MCLQDDREHLVRRRIRLRDHTPHPEFVQDFDERLMVVLTQRGIKLPEHCQLDSSHICNVCHDGTPFQRVKEVTVKKLDCVRLGLTAQ